MRKILLSALATFTLLSACEKKESPEVSNLTADSVQYTRGIWTQKASLCINRTYSVGFSIGSKGYIGTGAISGDAAKDFWQYDPKTDSWTQKASLPGQARTGAVGFSIGNRGYIGTGYNNDFPGTNLKDFWEYTPETNCWTQKADFPGLARNSAAGFSIGSKGYIGTGAILEYPYDAEDFWEYSPENDQWTRKADFPGGARRWASGFAIAGKGYIGTGTGVGVNYKFQKDLWQFDPGTNTWTQKQSLGEQTISAAAFATSDRGFLFTSTQPVGQNVKNNLWIYNPKSDCWSVDTTFSGERRQVRSTAFSVSGRGYIAFGTSGVDNENLNDLWQYTPENFSQN